MESAEARPRPPVTAGGPSVAGGASPLQARLAELRSLRDDLLVRSAAGRRYVALLETHGRELLTLLSRSGELWAEASATLRGVAEAPTREGPWPRELDLALVARARRIVERLIADASPALRRSLRLVDRDLAGRLRRGQCRSRPARRPGPRAAPVERRQVRLAPATTLLADAAGAALVLGGTFALWTAVLVAVW